MKSPTIALYPPGLLELVNVGSSNAMAMPLTATATPTSSPVECRTPLKKRKYSIKMMGYMLLNKLARTVVVNASDWTHMKRLPVPRKQIAPRYTTMCRCRGGPTWLGAGSSEMVADDQEARSDTGVRSYSMSAGGNISKAMA